MRFIARGKERAICYVFSFRSTRSKGNSVVERIRDQPSSRGQHESRRPVAEMAVRENSPPLLQSEFRCFFPSLLTFSTNAKSNSISSSTFGRFPVTFMKFHFSVRACVCIYRLDSGREEKISSRRSFFLLVLLFERTDKWMFYQFYQRLRKQRRGYKCMNENWKIRSKILQPWTFSSSIKYFEFGSKQRGCIIKNALDEFFHSLIVTQGGFLSHRSCGSI